MTKQDIKDLPPGRYFASLRKVSMSTDSARLSIMILYGPRRGQEIEITVADEKLPDPERK